MEEFVGFALALLGLYLVLGVILLAPFHHSALPRIDESARGASWGFRVAVSPGLIALWPIILWKWSVSRRGGHAHGQPDAPVSSHGIRRSQALVMNLIAIAVPLLVAAAIFSR